MAKKDATEAIDRDSKKEGNKVITILITLVIIIIWLGIFAILIKLDVGGFGSNVLRPVLKDVPIIQNILPTPSDETLAEENDYPYKSLTEAIAQIKKLELQLDTLQDTNNSDSDKIADLQAEVSRLKVFEEQQLEYEKKLKEFETEVVFADKAPDIEEYQKFYESISPENAAEIYRQVVEQMAYDQATKDQAERYAKMEPAAAAATLEIMTADLDLVCGILANMKATQSAAIMQEMDPNVLAKITKKMSTINP